MLLTERYADAITLQLSCFDRIIVHGSLQHVGYADGMAAYLRRNNIRIFDFPHFGKTCKDITRDHITKLAEQNDIAIQFVPRSSTRKEALVHAAIEARGRHPGIVAILSAMERCSSFMPWHNKTTNRTYLRHTEAKCLHYYVYFIDVDYGLCHLRIPTWLPARLQLYCNGHSWLEAQLSQLGLQYRMVDNLFVSIDEPDLAQALADAFCPEALEALLERCASCYCPVADVLGDTYHWSIAQAEYATDIVFARQEELAHIYDHLVRTAVHSVKPDAVATFFGRKLTAAYNDELGNRFDTRIVGTRLRHSMGPASIKMYDKAGIALRIETTTNDVSFFKHIRPVTRQDGSVVQKLAQMRRSIVSLPALRNCMHAANRRYLAFLSELDRPLHHGEQTLTRLSKTVTENDRPYKGLNFFDTADLALLHALARGEFHISGFRNKNLRKHFPKQSPGAVSRALKRLRLHGLIKRIGRTYKYYLTAMGRRVITLGLRLRQMLINPQLATC